MTDDRWTAIWDAYAGDPMDPKNNTEAGLRRVVELLDGTPEPQSHLVGLTADQLCTTPLIEDLVPTNEEWDACEVVKDRYNLMKQCVRRAFARAAANEGDRH